MKEVTNVEVGTLLILIKNDHIASTKWTGVDGKNRSGTSKCRGIDESSQGQDGSMLRKPICKICPLLV